MENELIENKTEEQWIQFLDTDYWLSSDGRVRGKNGMLKPYPNTSGYLQVRIYFKNGEERKMFLSYLIATCFVPNPNHFRFVHHIDENPFNNRAENLEWVETGSHPSKRSPKRRKLNQERRNKDIAQMDAVTGDIIHVWNRKTLKNETSFFFPYILRCCNNGCKHHGYKWRYIVR